MSRPADYFRIPARVAALSAECATWDGTPFRKHSRVRGRLGGADCENFIACVLANIGAITPDEFAAIQPPAYEVNHAEHSAESIMGEWFRRPEVRARVRPLDEDEPHLDGDFVFPVVGRCEHHIAFRIGDDVHHIVRLWGYCTLRVSQIKLHRSRYRLLDPTPSSQPSARS